MKEIEEKERKRKRERDEHEQEQGKGKRNERREKGRTWIDGKSSAVISIGFLSQNLSE